jgi:hypothetical protein
MPAQIGLQDPADLRYRYFASDEHRAVFTSQLPPEELLRRIAPGAKPQSGAQVAAAAEKRRQASENKEAAGNLLEEGLARSGLAGLAGLAKRATKPSGPAADTSAAAPAFDPVSEFPGDPAAVQYAKVERSGVGGPVLIAAGADRSLGATVLVVQY